MEDLTLPSVEGSLKKWVYYAPILPKALAHSPKLPKKIIFLRIFFIFFIFFNFKKETV
jgi:hypothetical protein